MYVLDCRGKACPVPVLETKKVLEEERPEELRISVDSETSCENVRRFLESRGYRVVVEGEGEARVLAASRQGLEGQRPAPEKKVVVFIDSETLGQGDDGLGSILMKSFILTLREIEPLPWRIIFMNGGVKLASEGSALLPYLGELGERGVEILSCGTCLDFFSLKEKLRSGRISNMFEIISSFTEATKVLKP
jgi:selenium metabolism protein YedF